MAAEKPNLKLITGNGERAPFAAWIRPLPADVVPSERFLRRLRLRILALSGQAGRPQAA